MQQLSHVFPLSTVNTRSINAMTEHLEKHRTMIERISDWRNPWARLHWLVIRKHEVLGTRYIYTSRIFPLRLGGDRVGFTKASEKGREDDPGLCDQEYLRCSVSYHQHNVRQVRSKGVQLLTVATPSNPSSAPRTPHLIRNRINAVKQPYAVARMARIHRFPAWSLSVTGENRMAESILAEVTVILPLLTWMWPSGGELGTKKMSTSAIMLYPRKDPLGSDCFWVAREDSQFISPWAPRYIWQTLLSCMHRDDDTLGNLCTCMRN